MNVTCACTCTCTCTCGVVCGVGPARLAERAAGPRCVAPGRVHRHTTQIKQCHAMCSTRSWDELRLLLEETRAPALPRQSSLIFITLAAAAPPVLARHTSVRYRVWLRCTCVVSLCQCPSRVFRVGGCHRICDAGSRLGLRACWEYRIPARSSCRGTGYVFRAQFRS